MKGAKVRDSFRSSCGRLVGQPVPLEVGDHALRPVVAAPDAQALLVVVGALEDLRAGQLVHDVRAADVVGVEVGDHDPRDLDSAQRLAPARLGVRQPEPGVDERPAVRPRQQVAVDVVDPERQGKREPADAAGELVHPGIQLQRLHERTFYTAAMRVEYREEPCKVALNRVKGMGFNWSLNPYMGCVHRCTFCYVRAFELRADRPFDDRYGRSIRVKTNIAEVLRCQLAKPTWERETVAIGAATDPYQPAEGRYRLTRACLEALRDASNPFSIITRGPLIIRDADVLAEAALRAQVSVTFSVPTLDDDDLAAHRAWHGSPAPAAASAEDTRRRGHPRQRGHGADPARPLRQAGAARAGRARGA